MALSSASIKVVCLDGYVKSQDLGFEFALRPDQSVINSRTVSMTITENITKTVKTTFGGFNGITA